MEKSPLIHRSRPLDSPLADEPVPITPYLSRAFEPDLFFDGDAFMHFVQGFAHVDVATYSVSKSASTPLRNVRRLITGLVFSKRTSSIKPCEHRRVMNNHCKMFLCYTGILAFPTQIYLGSQNLTHGTNLNLMYRVQQQHIKPLTEFFETLWNQAQ